jgi:hypothetical protein
MCRIIRTGCGRLRNTLADEEYAAARRNDDGPIRGNEDWIESPDTYHTLEEIGNLTEYCTTSEDKRSDEWTEPQGSLTRSETSGSVWRRGMLYHSVGI